MPPLDTASATLCDGTRLQKTKPRPAQREPTRAKQLDRNLRPGASTSNSPVAIDTIDALCLRHVIPRVLTQRPAQQTGQDVARVPAVTLSRVN